MGPPILCKYHYPSGEMHSINSINTHSLSQSFMKHQVQGTLLSLAKITISFYRAVAKITSLFLSGVRPQRSLQLKELNSSVLISHGAR